MTCQHDDQLIVILFMPDEPPHRQRTRYNLNALLAAVPILLEQADVIRSTVARGVVWSHPGNQQLARLFLIPVSPDEPWDACSGLTWLPDVPTQQAA